MSNKITPWIIAILCAILLHIMALQISAEQDWFDIEPQKVNNEEPQTANFELLLLPNEVVSSPAQNESISTDETLSSSSPALDEEETSTMPDANSPSQFNDKYFDLSTDTIFLADNLSNEDIDLSNPSLLDLSSMPLPSGTTDENLKNVFSEELRNKIAASKIAQQEYLKGQIKEVDYPVTKGPDGARYANIKGVCWRIPEVGSDEPWAVVFSGCTGESKTFNFELNIAPSVFLGTESPLFIGQ